MQGLVQNQQNQPIGGAPHYKRGEFLNDVREVNDEPQVKILKDIGMRLVEKCDGLPLGVKVIGGLMRQKRIRRTDWQKVLDDSLCEGFVHGTSDDLEEIEREYYDELIERNLIEPDKNYVDQEVCNMHDIVRSFAHNVHGDEALIAHNTEIGNNDKLKSDKFIRLSLANKGLEAHEMEWRSLQTQISLGTLISVGNIKTKPGDSFVSFSSLRTLHLDSLNLDAVAKSLYQLKHLRYLSIHNSNTSRLPENIGLLKFLQYISLSGCLSLAKLPCSIGMLQDLRFLRLDGTNISVVPRDFCGLTSLRKLYGFPADMDCNHCSLEALGPLSQLRELSINFLENVASSSSAIQAKLGEKNHLRYLSLCCTSRLGDDVVLVEEEEGISEKDKWQIEEVFDVICPPLGLENINIEGYFGQRLPRWMMPTAVAPLRSLWILTMDDLVCCTELPSGLSQLPCLELLQITKAPAIKHVGLELLQPNNQVGVAFPRLQELRFGGMVQWEEGEWEEQVKAMPTLEEFTLKMCKLRHLSSLEKFSSVVLLVVFRNTNLERISNLPKLQKLVIVMCPEMKVLEGMPALQRLNLEDYDMETVPRYLQDVNPRHLLLDCSLSLLTSIAAGKSGPEWHKFSHIQQVKAFATDERISRKRYVTYRRDPFRFETNISGSAIAQARNRRKWLTYFQTCPIEDEWLTGYDTRMQKNVCTSVCNAYRHLSRWLDEACLHCREADNIGSPSYQWTEAAVYSACTRIILTRQT
ncbi:putative disease resistance RPP13-like protein 1 [Miscanthus floridulus]|uniref:putative disease resistance RPP13-like protein 1 n=1 Tax=Miscanthus floridulus TaxID=154761 RepID=UPI003457A224